MKFRPAFILLAAFPLAVSAAETPAPAAPKPSVMQRLLHPFGGGAAPAAPTPAPVPAEVKESAPKSPKKQSGSASSAVKQAATPAPATPKPSMIDRLLHPFSEPATTEPPAPATPAPTKDAGTKTAKKDAAAAAPAPATPKPGMMQRLLHPFGGPAAPGAPAAKDASLKGLEMGASVEPPAPQLSETREVRVTVTLANKGKKLAQLAFPTNQRIEVLVKDKAGKNLVQWSEDQAFFAEPTLITINPGERLEYAATVSTRDLVAGETYTVEAFFPSFPELRRTLGLAPEK
jgi:hypothetical protein